MSEENAIPELTRQLDALSMQIQLQNKVMEEIQKSQKQIISALLGTLDRETPGLIEDHRILRGEVDCIKVALKPIPSQITELQAFKSNAKKIVATIAFAVPFLFEIGKGLLSMLWDYLAKKGSP